MEIIEVDNIHDHQYNNQKIIVEHYISGDSDYIVPVKIYKSDFDNGQITVRLGDLLKLNIVEFYDNTPEDHYCLIQVMDYGNYIKENDEDKVFKDRHDALDYIINKLIKKEKV